MPSPGVRGGHDSWCSVACNCIIPVSASVSIWSLPEGVSLVPACLNVFSVFCKDTSHWILAPP